ncbi:DUF4134 domain-containing protein [uncultured Prevotella sp.]|uniref:DUF4134 domain-containing protein n=1 Tax=uncultured Prevotella sp. TaxID=159272 RepID=UPI002805365E|nr:DUF4134 domain-containing protein [uncultured Prevotella sp.]
MNKILTTAKELAKRVFCSRIAMAAVAATISVYGHAQGTAAGLDAGKTAITQTTTSLKAYIPVITNLCYIIAGIVAILGALSVYNKMNNEEQDVKKSIMMVVGACIFLIAAAKALPAFFGL